MSQETRAQISPNLGAETQDLASFLTGINGPYLEALYEDYLINPGSIDPSLAQYFQSLGTLVPQRPKGSKVFNAAFNATFQGRSDQGLMDAKSHQAVQDSLNALMLIRSYRVRGHLVAALDPLGLDSRQDHPELDPKTYGFSADDYDRPIYIHGVLNHDWATLQEILHILNTTYADTIGVEFMHIQDQESKDWIQKRVENRQNILTNDEKKQLLYELTRAESFEKFLAVKFPGAKRFGLEGAESFIPLVEKIIKVSVTYDLEEVILGMAHRGRLNVLTNIMGKLPRAIFSEFQGIPAHPEDMQGSGDVKYHLGVSNDRTIGGKKIHLSLAANPSHLEAVNPVVVGKVRAKQARNKDSARDKILGILVHGDAAFAGQGVVAETLLLSDLGGYRTGGTIHIIINNQIGFTTSPHFSRSSPYSSDVAKTIQAPVFHVNGDDPEAVMWVAKLATDYRHAFKKDVVVDLFCYRRHGHNEMDEPSFTQPLMYKKIRAHPTTREIYARHLQNSKTLSKDQCDTMAAEILTSLQQEFIAASTYRSQKADWLEGVWSGQTSRTDLLDGSTGVDASILQKIGKALVTVPQGFALNSKLERLFTQKKDMFDQQTGFDWATAEALAFGCLLLEGHSVRLSGQDCGRGTFSHRHAVVVDQESGTPYIPLNGIADQQAELEIVDSPLAEASVLGFELGYSLADPHSLVLWEAQFGDFANGAQVIVDQFISSGEAKWLRLTGLVMLLPHGYEGQGPEHSSARLERYLQMCAEDNMIVANCTTPANYFHILRRQVVRPVRKPLIIMTPKSLLRDKHAQSSLKDMTEDTFFQKIILNAPQGQDPKKIKRVILCTGKVAYDLIDGQQNAQRSDVAIVRVEQLHPFPKQELIDMLSPYVQAEFIWCQEEPQNMGAWTFIDRRLEGVLITIGAKNNRPVYAGRAEAAATATGLYKKHDAEQQQLVLDALGY